MVKSIFDAIIPVDTEQEQEQEQVQELGQELGQEQVQATQGASIFDSIIPVASAAEELPVVDQNELQQDQTDPEQLQLTAQGRANAEAYVAQQIANALASKREGEEPTTIDKYSAATKKGVEAANLGWDLLANMAEEYFTGDTKNTEEILANQVNEYLQLQSDPRVISYGVSH